MKRIGFLLFFLFATCIPAQATWDKGFNFRASSGYVTDGANTTYSIGEVYPITRNSVTFGWDIDRTDSSRDRTTGNDARLAGIVFAANTSGSQTHNFRVDLAATGTCTIRLGAGDGGTNQRVDLELLDNTTVFATVANNIAVGSNSFLDATGTSYSAANWPGSNSTISHTFTSTILFVRLAGLSATTDSSVIAPLFLSCTFGGVPHRVNSQ